MSVTEGLVDIEPVEQELGNNDGLEDVVLERQRVGEEEIVKQLVEDCVELEEVL